VTDELIQAFDELLLVLNENPARSTSTSGESLMEKGLLGHPSALATVYESEKMAADARHQSRQRDGCTHSDDSDDEGDEFEDAVEDAGADLVDLEAGDSSRGSTGSCPAGFS